MAKITVANTLKKKHRTTKITIDWKKVWDSHDKWWNKFERYSKCGSLEFNPPDWEEQQHKIQRLINAQLKGQK